MGTAKHAHNTPGKTTGENPAQTTPPYPAGAHQGVELIRQKVRTLPHRPGVYRMIDRANNVLYVGKARDLKKRVESYTRQGTSPQRILTMVHQTTSMEFVTTQTESEALLLEANLIKRYKPRFNILLRDDKSFPYILIESGHQAPRLSKHRGAKTRKGNYYGPFASVGAVNHTLHILQRAFLLRSCSDNVYNNRSRPCLLYQIKRCSAPCTGEITPKAYQALTQQAQDFLSGKTNPIQKKLIHAMKKASDAMDFERAAFFRDRIRALREVLSQQNIIPNSKKNTDILAAGHHEGRVCVQVFFLRGGQNFGTKAYFPRHSQNHTTKDVLKAFTTQFYDTTPLPDLILLSQAIEDQNMIGEAFTVRRGRKVTITVPQHGHKAKMVRQAEENAHQAMVRRTAEVTTQIQLLQGLAAQLGIKKPIQRIEIYDNSHIQGSHALGGMVVAGREGFIKNQYRTFNIAPGTVVAGDDLAMMEQVLRRRLAPLCKDRQNSKHPHAVTIKKQATPKEAALSNPSQKIAVAWPDLIIIDGGKTQIAAVGRVLQELNLDIPLLGIAKGKNRHGNEEKFFYHGQGSIKLQNTSPLFHYLQRLRDEAHRFAIGGHRQRRKKTMHRSILDDIPGIGRKRKQLLLQHFGSASAVAKAGKEDLSKIKGISGKTAQFIYDTLHA